MSDISRGKREPAKNRANEINNIFGMGLFLLTALIVGALIMSRVLINLVMEENLVACFLNIDDLKTIIASELYAERTSVVMALNFILDNALNLVVFWLYIALFADYMSWFVSKYILAPRGVIEYDHPECLKKPFLTNTKSMIRYSVLSVLLIGTTYAIVESNRMVMDVYQSRHTLIRDYILPDLEKNGLAVIDKDLSQCTFNTDITVITGDSYIAKK